VASCASSRYWRRYLEKVWRPYSLLESGPVWSAKCNTLGLAMESNIEVHSGEVISPAPTTKGCGSFAMTAPKQNERVVLWQTVRVSPKEFQDIVPPSRVREGVIHGITSREFCLPWCRLLT